jgi:soluble lytic murein transglycosylase-like protein
MRSWTRGSEVRRLVVSFVALMSLVCAATPARAELVFFQSGSSLSIRSHREDGSSLVLTMRGGGEMVCDASIIARFEPDEVPYPEPVAEVAVVAPIEAASTVPYGAIIDRISAEQGVPAKLVRAVIQVESAYQERARSKKGAMGLMQLMPQTARQYAVANPYDPEANIEAGIKYLKSLMERLPVSLALAAYNAGEGAVQRFHGIPPYPETQQYVSRILQLAR